ncbi:MerR family transcriptional regulator [Cytobacillus kochii]|uniref:MerR family transcriptional regulator n=1 Tax=Cytobacillus kochii TaxID=859143 RepID=A0A248TH37_9BACI|nr:MerR family transcriptional regulator [Cytobacillus kochii]ASV67439.1 MerR family transcriptional regulator [Cytobacillus kochii]MED1607649.1 MerR family transcriptional regulator [Cytobacillus kochii]
MKTIREVAAKFDVSTRTIRYYEELGLISSNRSEGNHRLYTKKECAKLKLIFRGKRYGFSLEEIKEMVLLFDYDRTGMAQLERTITYGNQRIQQIDQAIEELLEMKEELLSLKKSFSERLEKLVEERDRHE